ncbi:MAG: bacterial Ig-like domain-containing protein, partial [Clostridia bacterium]|nr:bacterial Ig-like domain-containing protein [Clostridia bacterium]
MKKQLKKSLSLLLTLVMVLSLLPTAALAATAITPTTPAGSGTSADPYRIGTAEELYGFAKIVNDGDTDAHAILTADITVNENVLSYNALNGTEEDFVAWDPINLYYGIFDGRGHTISGLFISYTESNQYDHCGFIEELHGIVRDLTISDSYFRVCYGYYSSSGGVATASANRNIGGICGKLDATGTVWQCHFDGVIDADQGTSTGGFKIGGIVGHNLAGVIKECSVSGRVDGKAGGSESGVGGIVGVSSGGTVTRCCTNAPVTNVTAPSATKNGQASVGGIVGSVSYDGTVTDSYTSYNSGSIWGYGYVGGIVGSAEGCDIQRCWNHSALINLNTVLDEPKTDTYVYMGGILCHAGGTITSNVIKNCYNRGALHPGWRAATSDIGPFIGAGIVGNYDGSMNASLSISYCHNMGNYYGEHPNNASDTYNPIVTEDKGTISNCYYKIDNNEVGERDEVANTVAYQLRDFENGTVVDLLNDQPLFGNQNYWEQGKESPELVARPEIVPTRLEILTHPTKTAYIAGEDFDPTGMVVQMHYSDGSVLPVVGYTVSGGECMLNTVKSVTIRYTDNGVTRQTDE